MCRASHQHAVIMVIYYHSKIPLKWHKILHIQNSTTDLLQCSIESTCARHVHRVSSLKWSTETSTHIHFISMVANYDEEASLKRPNKLHSWSCWIQRHTWMSSLLSHTVLLYMTGTYKTSSLHLWFAHVLNSTSRGLRRLFWGSFYSHFSSICFLTLLQPSWIAW